jgi:hypothetical protein
MLLQGLRRALDNVKSELSKHDPLVESGQATFSMLDLDLQNFDSDIKSEGTIGICSTLFIGYQTVTVPREFDRRRPPSAS